MAETKINGKERFLFLDLTGGTDYDLVVCLTANSYNRASSTIDASSYCGPDTRQGAQTITIDFTGQVMYNPDAGHISEGELNDAWQADSTVGWKLARGIPEDGDSIYEGQGSILSLNDSGDLNSMLSFTASIGVSGIPTRTVFGES